MCSEAQRVPGTHLIAFVLLNNNPYHWHSCGPSRSYLCGFLVHLLVVSHYSFPLSLIFLHNLTIDSPALRLLTAR